MKNWLFIMFIFICSTLFGRGTDDIAYLYPIPGSNFLPKETVIITRFAYTMAEEVTNLNSFVSVRGDESGKLTGRTIISTDRKTIIFKPHKSFIAGEEVSVQLTPQKIGNKKAFLNKIFTFTIAKSEINVTVKKNPDYTGNIEKLKADKILEPADVGDPIISNGVSVPSDFPWVNVTIKDNPDSGYIFLNNWGGSPYNMILDTDGNPIWYLKTDDRRRDFKLQPDGRLTMLVRQGYGGGGHIALDSTYAVVDTFFAPPGYVVDEHELQVLPNGHYFLITLDWQVWDMSLIIPGGNPNATVVGNHVVEMDADDNPVFIWRSWDNYTITDAIHENLTANYIDYVHMNAIAVDLDGHLLVSSRHMSEVTKINRQTGAVIWRLGGQNDNFTWNDNNRISYQHDIRVLSDGNYTIFDNGNHHTPNFSRSLELKLDTLNWTATKIWEFRDSPDKYTWWMGNSQRLPSGNTLINWADGSLPKITEVRPDGSKTLELNFENNAHCYRVFKFPWKGIAAKPYLVIEPKFDRITLLFNKFGDQNVSHYKIYGGLTPHPEQVIATTEEPFIHLFELTNLATYYFRVTSMNSQGQESDYSNEEDVYVRIIPPGVNMITNGNFSEGFNYWDFNVEGGQASATPFINGFEELEINISEAGSEYWHIQAFYPNLSLIEGEEYLFEFDAYAEQNRIIEAEIKKDGDPWTNYSRKGLTLITQTKQHYSHPFVMTDPSALKARVVLNVGGVNADVYFDNISLRRVVTSIDHHKDDQPFQYFLDKNYPNPFNPVTTITYYVPHYSYITISVYNLLGELVKSLIDLPHNPGMHKINFDASKLSSGLYFYKMTAQSINRSESFSQTRKMIILK